MRAARLIAQFIVIAALFAGVAALSDWPKYSQIAKDSGVVMLTFVHGADRKGECRRLTPEEIAKLPPNMRRVQDCPRGRRPIYVELDVDGHGVYRASLPPTGVAGDGPSRVYQRFVLPAGTTLNKNGAAVYKAATAVFLANLYGVDLGFGQLVTIVLTTMVASSAGAGVPGSSLVTTLIVLNAIGLGPDAASGIRVPRRPRRIRWLPCQLRAPTLTRRLVTAISSKGDAATVPRIRVTIVCWPPTGHDAEQAADRVGTGDAVARHRSDLLSIIPARAAFYLTDFRGILRAVAVVRWNARCARSSSLSQHADRAGAIVVISRHVQRS